ncbi:MAG TPA: radical SAM protein [Clostridiales bacterium]|nr:radical SAM protein [Clostridiales bacterium]
MIEIKYEEPFDIKYKTLSPYIITSKREKNSEYRKQMVKNNGKMLRDSFLDKYIAKAPLFRIVSVETKTGCNISCSFCPVGKDRDPRPIHEMPLKVIKNIALQLKEINYKNSIMLFCNNEPLLDERIIEIVNIMKVNCPQARLKILTNGTKLSIKMVQDLFKAGLTVLEIDNYTDGQKIIKPVKEVIKEADRFNQYNIKINLRKINEILYNRAGTSPNKLKLDKPLKQFCALPFTDINIVGEGNVTVCCFDALNKTSMGNINQNSIIDIWYNSKFDDLRQHLLRFSRNNYLCDVCDYDGYRSP